MGFGESHSGRTGGTGLRLYDPGRLCQYPDDAATTVGPQFCATAATEFSSFVFRIFRHKPAQQQPSPGVIQWLQCRRR